MCIRDSLYTMTMTYKNSIEGLIYYSYCKYENSVESVKAKSIQTELKWLITGSTKICSTKL